MSIFSTRGFGDVTVHTELRSIIIRSSILASRIAESPFKIGYNVSTTHDYYLGTNLQWLSGYPLSLYRSVGQVIYAVCIGI